MSNPRYHLLPEEGRPSTDSVREDERLLGSIPKKPITFTGHPTFFLRLVALGLFIAAFVFHIVSRCIPSRAAIVFLAFAITRNALIILNHVVKIKIECVRRDGTPARRNQGKSKIMKLLASRLSQFIIDFILIIPLLLIGSLVVKFSWLRWPGRLPATVACIITWVAM